MSNGKFSLKLIIGILLAISFGVALSVRIFLPYDQVFSGGWIKFTGVDAYYHIRLVDNMVHNFPALTNFDPFFIYPGGGGVGNIHFFDWLLAGIIWIIGLGAPTQHTTDVVGVYFPAILGALTVIPVYFIGKALFNRWIGVLAAALIAVMSGEFLGRSILGFTDQHVAEVLFTTVTMLFLILAVKTARQRQLKFSDLKPGNWKRIGLPLIYSLLAGIFLLIYLFSWLGALLFVFIIALYFVIQFIVDHARGEATDYLGIVGAIAFLSALVLFVPFAPGTFYSIPIIIAFLIPLVLSGLSRWMASRGLKPVYYPLALVGIGLVGIGMFYAVYPSLPATAFKQFGILNPLGDTSATTLEMQPIFMPGGRFSLKVIWGNFTTGFYFSIISLGLLIWRAVKQGSAERNLLLVWTGVILLATLGQRRFAYYFAVNIAVFTAYFAGQFLQLVALVTDWLSARISLNNLRTGLVRALDVLPTAGEAASPKTSHRTNYYPMKYVLMSLAIIIVFLFAFFYNITSSVSVARQARFAPSNGWLSALDWMRENTPEPLNDPAAYYRLYEPPPPDESFAYPESAYGVMSWWDYGYWITRIARRLPNATPSQDPLPITSIARLFLSQEEAAAPEIMQKLDSSYLILDYMTVTTKFWAIISWADQEQTRFFERYYLPYEGNKLMPVHFFYPEYYRSMSVRLYNFNGEAVNPETTLVICYEEKTRQDKTFKQVTDIETFSSYDEARDYIESNKSANCRIVGSNPFISPVPLEALKNYKLVYASDSGITQPDVGVIPEVKIFAYSGN